MDQVSPQGDLLVELTCSTSNLLVEMRDCLADSHAFLHAHDLGRRGKYAPCWIFILLNECFSNDNCSLIAILEIFFIFHGEGPFHIFQFN